MVVGPGVRVVECGVKEIIGGVTRTTNRDKSGKSRLFCLTRKILLQSSTMGKQVLWG